MERFGTMEFQTKKELFKFMTDNRDSILAQKKAVKKEAECPVIVPAVIVHDKPLSANKADTNPADYSKAESLKVVCIINTTNYLDNHGDVHIPGLWNRSIQNNKAILHVQEHESRSFEKIIASGKDLKVYTKTYTWKELGYDYEGTTEALVFESTILSKRNAFMLAQYANGWVQNHSVGMFYVKMDFAVNDEDYPNEYDAWKKYYPHIANKEVADERGYFFYVLEAKCVEGSAVPLGSNSATPTLSVELTKDMVRCPECGHEFDYNSVPETSMGAVSCPKCDKPVNQKSKSDPSNDTRNDNTDPAKTTQKIDYNKLSELLTKVKI